MISPHLAVANANPAAPARARPTARRLALGAVAGPALFTLAWLVLGFHSPGYTLFGTLIAPYSPISQPISGLGLGSTGAFMNTAFVLSGLLLLAGVAGIFQTVGPSGRRPAGRVCAALLALSPLGLVVAGSFTLEAVMPHLLGFLLASGTPVASYPDHGTVPARHPRLAAVWHLAAAGQSTDAGAAGRLLPHLRPGCGRRQHGDGRPCPARAGRRGPRLVRGHGVAGLPPLLARRRTNPLRSAQGDSRGFSASQRLLHGEGMVKARRRDPAWARGVGPGSGRGQPARAQLVAMAAPSRRSSEELRSSAIMAVALRCGRGPGPG